MPFRGCEYGPYLVPWSAEEDNVEPEERMHARQSNRATMSERAEVYAKQAVQEAHSMGMRDPQKVTSKVCALIHEPGALLHCHRHLWVSLAAMHIC